MGTGCIFVLLQSILQDIFSRGKFCGTYTQWIHNFRISFSGWILIAGQWKDWLSVGTVVRDEICQIFLRYFEIILHPHIHRPARNQDVINPNIKQSCESKFIAFCLRVGITGTFPFQVQFYWKILRCLIKAAERWSVFQLLRLRNY